VKRIAPTFDGHLLDFYAEEKHVQKLLKEVPEPPFEFTIPSVKPMDSAFPKDAAEAKALDITLAEVSNQLLGASGYLLEVLSSMNEDSDKRLGEFIFRAFCLTANATTKLEIERLLRPGDRDKVGDHSRRSAMPSVIQDVRRSVPNPTTSTVPQDPPPSQPSLFDLKPEKRRRDSEGSDKEPEHYFRSSRGRGTRPRRVTSNFYFRRRPFSTGGRVPTYITPRGTTGQDDRRMSSGSLQSTRPAPP
jgi:hypothetical protein